MEIYKPHHAIRLVTAASLFDGHDAAINIMRRIIQATGCEVIHLGHNRSVREVVDTAIQEDVQGIAITSYQGGHTEYFKYMYDLLLERNCGHIKIFGGGGGTILPFEIEELHEYGISRIYSPDDGRKLGLQGMINDLVSQCDFQTVCNRDHVDWSAIKNGDQRAIARAISFAENHRDELDDLKKELLQLERKNTPVLGITGTGGAGKSSLTDELIRRLLTHNPEIQLGVISVDPSKRKSGGALLGDRIRMNSIYQPGVYMRSMASRGANISLSSNIKEALEVLQHANFDLIILESSGIGQADSSVVDYADASLYVMTPEYGASSQLEKIDMIDFADFIAINKFDKRGAADALKAVAKQYKRSRLLWDTTDEELPVVGTIASQFNDTGVDALYSLIAKRFPAAIAAAANEVVIQKLDGADRKYIVPPGRVRYLSEIAEGGRNYLNTVEKERKSASSAYQLRGAAELIEDAEIKAALTTQADEVLEQLSPNSRKLLRAWEETEKAYSGEQYTYVVRGREIKVALTTTSLSKLEIPKISLPRYKDWGDLLSWMMRENVPGSFPYTAGVYPFKRAGEDPTRMFAGEGGPERTNRRFHYVSFDSPAKRLSTAFDSVTLYGEDPDHRPDIYGKVGNSGVSVATLDDAKKLYSGFDLCSPLTSVSMTINGPAPIILAYFLNAAVDQLCEKYIVEQGLEREVEDKLETIFKEQRTPRPTYHGDLPEGNNGLGLMLLGVTGDQVLPQEVYQKLKAEALNSVRGTVQADILKEDQAQNTCILSTEFALRLMGDIQEYFIDNKVRNFYSVSISGYHIAEAGANPITQLALTLANGFTYVEYYLSRGMNINEFAPNLSFFFSNGLDPEYAVIGRVARRIWAIAMRNKYGADERSQMLKYHIQTSGRSLHAQEIDFNDIRTTLQALYAIYDNCNSLHTNAYDEAITTPTEESVRRAMAIQLIINKELGLANNENPLQGSFIIEELTELVEEAVYAEFDRITERGGVLGAMENMYQRNKIQEESMYYETLKHTGELPIIGVNTFLSSKGSPTILPSEVIRATEEEKVGQISSLQHYQSAHKQKCKSGLEALKNRALADQNLFEGLMETAKTCSLGQVTHALYEVGGQYRRNM